MGSPNRRKCSAVSAVIERFNINGKSVSVTTMAFGSTWRRRIVRFETPSDWAARRTRSCAREGTRRGRRPPGPSS